MRSIIWRTTLLASVALALSCDSAARRGTARVYVSIGRIHQAAEVTAVDVTVSGPGIPGAGLTSHLTLAAGNWSGVIGGLPVGAGHNFHAEARNAQSQILYAGDVLDQTISATVPLIVLIVAQEVNPPTPPGNAAPLIDSITASALTPAPTLNVSLQGVAHDPDAGETATLAFHWSANAGAFDPLTVDHANTTWTAPATPGPVTLTFKVTDVHGAYAAVDFTIDVEPASIYGGADVLVALNTWPTVTKVLASPGQISAGGSTQLIATAGDADGDALSFAWNGTCPGHYAPSAVAQNPTFVAAATAAAGPCNLTVHVSDGRGGTNDGLVTIVVGPPPALLVAPIIDTATQDSSAAFAGEAVSFAATAHDPGGVATLTYGWTSDAQVGFGSAGAAATTASAPNCSGIHTITLTVTGAAGLQSTQDFHLATCPVSCDQLHDAHPEYGNGAYLINPSQTADTGGNTFVYCDMQTGGWTLVAKAGQTVVSKDDFSSDLDVNNLQDASTPQTGQYSHFSLGRFDFYGNAWTVRTQTDTLINDSGTGERYQSTYWRPRLTPTPANLTPGQAGTNWAVNGAYGALVYLNRSTISGANNHTWLEPPTYEIPPAPAMWLFSYRINALSSSGTDCLDALGANGQTQLCHSPAGGIISGISGTYSAAFGVGDGTPHAHVKPVFVWILNRNADQVPR